MERKKSQHFVWRRYLQNWAYNGSLIYRLKNNQITGRRPRKCACQKYFYKLDEITQRDLDFLVEVLIKDMDVLAQECAKKIIAVFSKLIVKRDKLLNTYPNNKDISHDLKTLYINIEENYHSRIENDSIKFLDSLGNEDIAFFADRKSIEEFYLFLTTQYFRTKNLQEIYVKKAAAFSVLGESLKRSWSVMRFIFAHNVAIQLNLRVNKTSLLLLQNKSDVPFITGDQPVINTKATYHSGTNDIPEELELYYPITPTVAILLNPENNRFYAEKCQVTKAEATIYNNLIADASHQELFAQDKSHLEPYLK